MSFCIFCGAAPSEKTREHIIPQWLLALTGDPNRMAYFGRDWLSPDLKKRIYSWKAFTFPACDACNGRWSKIEGEVKGIVERMLASAPLAAQDFYVFLDWIAKVRTGLWLGMLYLNKNYRGIIPQFHIDDRVRQKDRALIIYQADDEIQGIGLSGVDSPIFHKSPSIFSITINQLSFVSVSSDFILAKQLGWPYPTMRKMADIDTDGFSADINAGTQEITPPVLASLPLSPGTVLLQPIAHQYLRRVSAASFEETFLNPYVKASSIDEKSGIGRLLIGNDHPIDYPDEPTNEWRPTTRHKREVLSREIALWTSGLQRSVFADQPDFSHFPGADREARTKEIEGVLKLQDSIIQHLRDGGM
jgi:hypothetical protein